MWELLASSIKLIAALVTGLVGPAIILWLKRLSEDNLGCFSYFGEPDQGEVEEEVQFSMSVHRELRKILDKISADRVWVARFHNGASYLNSSPGNRSVKKISTAFEVTAPGVSKEIDAFSNMLVSFFAELFEKIIDKGHVAYSIEMKGIESAELDLILKQRGSGAIHLFPMHNINGHLTGIMGVDFLEGHNGGLTEEQISYVNVKSNLLAGYIYYGSPDPEAFQSENSQPE